MGAISGLFLTQFLAQKTQIRGYKVGESIHSLKQHSLFTILGFKCSFRERERGSLLSFRF